MKKFIVSLLALFAGFFYAVCESAAHLKYAIVQNPIIGRARKSAGGMTFTTLFGQNVMKAKVFQINDAKSAAQLLVRAAQKACVKIIASISDGARGCFEKQPSDMSAYSKLISQLQSIYLNNTPYGISDDVVFGSGTIDTVKVAAAFETTTSSVFTVDISGTPLTSMGNSTDKMYLILVNATQQFAQIIHTSYVRNAMTAYSSTFDSRYKLSDAVWCYIAWFDTATATFSAHKAGADLANVVK